MYLKELTINGFKSFAKKSNLEFSAAITAIVGPNGSGKSNVAESFRFVLGEQSVKSMRGKRGEDLIWGGSASVSRANRAAVEVKLDNTKRIFALDFDEIIIERVVHRDGQNEYKINGSSVRLKDVQELLAAANIGATGHHIISQGEADRILSAGPAERRSMVEDALGLKVYQYKKNEAEKKLEKTRTNILQVESLRREHAPHLRYLKKQVERLEKSLAIQEELKEVYAEYLKREDIYLSTEAKRLETAKYEPERLLKEMQAKLSEAKARVRASQNQDSMQNEVLTVENDLSRARAAKLESLRLVSQLEGQVSYLQRRLERPVAQSVSETVVSLKDYEILLKNIERAVAETDGREDIPLLRRTLSGIVHSLRLFLDRAQPQAVADGRDKEEVELKEATASLEKVRAEYALLQQSEVEAQASYDAVKQAMESENAASREAERDIFTLSGSVREQELVLERIDRELEVITREREEWKREVQEAVALLKSAASLYLNYVVRENGVEISEEIMAGENRGRQHERRRALEKLKIRLEELGQGTTDEVLVEYKNAVERDEFLAREITDLQQSVEKLEILIKELTEQIHTEFTAGIDKIAVEFERFFVLMFGGGKAGLRLVAPIKRKNKDEDDVVITDDEEEGVSETEHGVELVVSLPNKRVKGLEMLSGGERALTSIALIFAMSQVNPPPFIILDETDAALDEANSRRYGDMIEALAEKSQLILITHNRETMSRAGILYGVTMGGDGISKLLSVKFDEAALNAKS